MSWRSWLCYGKVQDSGSTGKHEKKTTNQKPSQRNSSSDFSNATSNFSPEDLSLSLVGSDIYSFSVAELKTVTQNFSNSQVIGEGGFGQVYKGYIDEKLRPGIRAQPVAIKLMDQDGLQGHREWLVTIKTCRYFLRIVCSWRLIFVYLLRRRSTFSVNSGTNTW